MKAISFLGTGDYKRVTYYWQQHEFQTELFPEAVVNIFKPEKLFLLITPTVKKHENFKNLCERLNNLVEPKIEKWAKPFGGGSGE